MNTIQVKNVRRSSAIETVVVGLGAELTDQATIHATERPGLATPVILRYSRGVLEQSEDHRSCIMSMNLVDGVFFWVTVGSAGLLARNRWWT